MNISRNNLCIIPARGGSKRIPRKNIKNFLGKPIIAYSIEAALNSRLFSEVMVSTDDIEIAEIAKKYGASVPFLRTNKNANDFATLSEVIEEVKNGYKLNQKKFDLICCLLPTAPFVNSFLLNESYLKFVQTKADSLRPIVKYSYPIQRSYRLIDNIFVEFLYPEFAKTRSQDLEPIYHDAGLFYWMKFSKGLNGALKAGFIISEKIVQDIDTFEDWEIAELKYKLLHENI